MLYNDGDRFNVVYYDGKPVGTIFYKGQCIYPGLYDPGDQRGEGAGSNPQTGGLQLCDPYQR